MNATPAKPYIQRVGEAQIRPVFRYLGDAVLARHDKTLDKNRNTHVIFGADEDRTAAIFAEAFFVDHLRMEKPGVHTVLTFERAETAFPYDFAGAARHEINCDFVRESPLYETLNGQPLATMMMHAVHQHAEVNFVDIKRVVYSDKIIDFDYLNTHDRGYLENYVKSLKTLSAEEYNDLALNMRSLKTDQVWTHNLRADRMRFNITNIISPSPTASPITEKDQGIIHVHCGSREFIELDNVEDITRKKKSSDGSYAANSLPYLLNRRDPAANIVVVDCVNKIPLRRQKIQEFKNQRVNILHYELPIFSAWKPEEKGTLKPADEVQAFWNTLCFYNDRLKFVC